MTSAKDIDNLRRSGTFDAEWYLKTYPDVQALGMDPVYHYLWLGARLGRRMSGNGNTKAELPTDLSISRAKAMLAAAEDPINHLAIKHRTLFEEGFAKPSLEPEVSVIIAAYNKVDFTLRCLDSIRRHQESHFEVILVDDQSSDQTSNLCPNIPNLVYMRNEKNLGFLLSSNRGVTCARGKYVLFLNNDTEVTPGWLRTLVRLLDSDSRIGAAGSKLIYPNGHLQEAGAIYFRDASSANFGRDDPNPEKPEYCYVREVDKCSGACLLPESVTSVRC
ncbi:MAG: hypothetical protein B7Y80_19720 [Hyphomicrobium sp. 32-62-53]|nr:MAG: hypothetical protein B7Z29_19130 [Hyphomicrobium sp. 12-62-95]OYX97452.1 MAG: hypothetical protein B7Y80_19720 [Hyphomicrobium sp. 32-62-53]